ncbi:MAG: RNA polymerase sigma factor [Phycisphaerales bacterium]|nr:RNA polymerase sigma factor [Phycisphaerales bacterium]
MPDADLENEPRELTPAVRDRLVRLAYRFVWNRSDAEDAVHNAVALAQTRRRQLRETTRWWSWMCRIVVRQCVALGRGQSRREIRERQRAGTDRSATTDERRDAVPADHAAIALERAAVLRRAIDELPPKQRAAVTLRHLEGMEYERIAEIMEIAPATVRVHVRDAREALRVRLVREYSDWTLAVPVRTVKEQSP